MKSIYHSLCTFLLLGAFITGCAENNAPDLILFNGEIITVDSQNTVAQALAVKNGKVLRVGDNETILALSTDDTQRIDLKGDTLIPGFIGVHEHPTLEAVFANTIDVSGFTHSDAASMWQYLESQVNQHAKGEWVYAMGIDPILFPEMKLPTLKELDQIAPDNPLVLISQTMHSFWANSLAFKTLNISADTPDPGHGSYYQKDGNGELTGFISESEAAAPFLEKLKSPLSIIENYEKTLDGYLSSGYTAVASLGFNAPPWLAKYASSDNFIPRIRQYYYVKPDELDMLPDSPDNGNDYFAVLGVKLWHDGSPYTGSMQLKTPYEDTELTRSLGLPKGHKGNSRMSAQEFTRQIKHFSQQGWQLAIHSQGDLSNELVAKAMTQLSSSDSQRRHRVEHGLLVSKESLQSMSQSGMTPSFHINHIFYYGDALIHDLIGDLRAQEVLPVRYAFELNMHPTLHADGPMFPTTPFHLMQTAILRKSRSGTLLGKEQAITVEQALKAMTYNGAWQLNKEHHFGSLEKGKFADFVRLSENPLTFPVEKWQHIQILETWVAGHRKFDKP